MPRKKIDNYQVIAVYERRPKDEYHVRLQQQLRDPSNSPDGTFITHLSEIILPKRKRGTKFKVTYTKIFQKEL